jgi:hypothetical protein
MIINHVFLQRASAFLLDVLQYLSSYIGLFQIDSHMYYFLDNDRNWVLDRIVLFLLGFQLFSMYVPSQRAISRFMA